MKGTTSIDKGMIDDHDGSEIMDSSSLRRMYPAGEVGVILPQEGKVGRSAKFQTGAEREKSMKRMSWLGGSVAAMGMAHANQKYGGAKWVVLTLVGALTCSAIPAQAALTYDFNSLVPGTAASNALNNQDGWKVSQGNIGVGMTVSGNNAAITDTGDSKAFRATTLGIPAGATSIELTFDGRLGNWQGGRGPKFGLGTDTDSDGTMDELAFEFGGEGYALNFVILNGAGTLYQAGTGFPDSTAYIIGTMKLTIDLLANGGDGSATMTATYNSTTYTPFTNVNMGLKSLSNGADEWNGLSIHMSGGNTSVDNLTLSAIPEPSSLSMFGAAVVVLLGRRRRVLNQACF